MDGRRRTMALSALLVWAVAAAAGGDAPPPGGSDAPAAARRLSAQVDPRTKETLVQPAYDSWTLYDLRFYPILRRATDGTKALLLYVSTQGDRPIGLRSLEVDIDGSKRSVTLKRSDTKTDSSGCRVLETARLEAQDDLIHALAGAREASVRVVGVRTTHLYRLSDEELADFAEIEALLGGAPLPEPETPQVTPEDGTNQHRFTPPQIIRSSRVNPEFPVMARDRMARGKVTLRAVVHPDGTPEFIDVLKSSARYCGFEQAAINALRKWRYVPGQKDGKPADFDFTIDFDFVWR